MSTAFTTTGTSSGNPILELLRGEVAAWQAVADGTSRKRFAEVPNRFIFVDHVGRIGTAGRNGFDGIEFVDADPDLIGVDIGLLETAKAGAQWAGSDKVVVLDVIDYARARAERAQAELDCLVERLEQRERDVATRLTKGGEASMQGSGTKPDWAPGAILKTVIEVTVLHREGIADGGLDAYSLRQIAHEIEEGDWLGAHEITSVEEVQKELLHGEQLALGNDGSFFSCDDGSDDGGEAFATPRG
ncbi:hypothetical protein LJR175_008311 [Variovorax sp. LjRoot175]|uniref:hypothetical protein n=1 Tax=Variovorax sp. LjRoot175 TaxID=3342276 RepID=UPI003ECEE164